MAYCNRFLLILCVLTLPLSACQQATSYTPHVTEQELAQERAIQKSLARDARQNSPTKGKAGSANLEAIAARIQPSATELCRIIHTRNLPCTFPIILGEGEGMNAYADGEKVVVLMDMLHFARNDIELAYVVAHEMAHNIMRHPDSTRNNAALGGLVGALIDTVAATQGVNTQGGLSKLGTQGAILRYSKGFEREADYIGLYILARAGYDISAAPNFWRRMSAKNPNSIYVGTTHPTNPERYVAMKKTIQEIKTKQANNHPLIPERKV